MASPQEENIPLTNINATVRDESTDGEQLTDIDAIVRDESTDGEQLTDIDAIVRDEQPRSTKKDMCISGRRPRYIIVTIFCVLSMILVISHTGIRITRFSFNEQTCGNSTIDHDYEILSEEYNEISSEAHRYYHFSQFLYIMFSFLHWFEYGYLFYGLFSYIQQQQPQVHRNSKKEWCRKLMLFLKQSALISWGNEQSKGKKILKTIVQPAFVVLIFLFFAIVTIASPAIDIAIFHNRTHNTACEITHAFVAINYLFHGQTMIARTLAFFVRVMMLIAVAECRLIWIKETPRDNDNQQARATTDREAAVNRYYDIMSDYRKKMDQTKPIYRVFRSWFIFQWIHYLCRISHDLVYLLRPWIWNETLPVSSHLFLTRNIVNCLYDLLVILSSYLPALKMNAYLRRYIRGQQQKQRDEALKSKSKEQYAYTESEFKIEMLPRSDFIPRVPGFGINLSLRGPGFIIGTAILVLGSVASFSKF